MNNLREILSPIKNELDIFEKKLKNVIDSSDNFLHDDLIKFIFASSKRLRPIFVFLFSKILEIEKNEMVQKIALSAELVHSASLIHDDIIDEDKLRRNNPTFFEKFGSKIAVLEGDLMLSMALNVLSNTSLDIVKIFSNRIKDTINGELSQNEGLFEAISLEKYIKKSLDKTANIFLMGLESLFTLKEVSKELKDNLIYFLKNYCLAFQIKNDIDDFKNDKKDIKNGNYTLVMLYFLKENEFSDLKNICVEKYVKQANLKMLEYKKTALDYLNKIENSQYKKALIEIVNKTIME